MMRERRANSIGCCSAYISRALPDAVNWSTAKMKVLVSGMADTVVWRWVRMDSAVEGSVMLAMAVCVWVVMYIVVCGVQGGWWMC